jgi:hypothetical protein
MFWRLNSWGSKGFLVLVGITSFVACRRVSFSSRGDSAAVVVVAPRTDAAGPPRVMEQEPNDSPEQAQLLAINADWPVVSVVGALSGTGAGAGKDVDVFKLLVPGGRSSGAKPAPSPDSSSAEDPRALARRLTLEIAAEGGMGLSVQLLDEGLKLLETVTVDAGQVAGMPNMAVLPGHTYYFRVKAVAKPAKAVDRIAISNYKLTVQLGDFEAGDEREPNDGIESAEAVTVSGTVELAGFYGWAHDQDFYRIPAPDVPSALELELDAVEGVTAGLQVLDGSGARIAVGRGRRGERIGLHNVIAPVATADAGATARYFYVVVRGEAGQNRMQRYVLHLSLGAPRSDSEVEPNDNPSKATLIHDGVLTGFLPVGDVDYFRYSGEGQREVSIEFATPARVRAKLEVIRPSNGQTIASAEARKAREPVAVSKIPTLGEALLLRLSQGKGDGNPNESYSLKISSTLLMAPKSGATNPPAALNPD